MTTPLLVAALMTLATGNTEDIAPDDTTVVLQGVTVSGQR